MSRQLRTYVEVDGKWYAPGVDVPADVAKLITNPKAWAEDDAPTAKTPSAAKPAPKGN